MSKKNQYDDSQLKGLISELEPKARIKILKQSMRGMARELQKIARTKLMATGVAKADELSKGIRALVWKRAVGFRVTVGSKRIKKDDSGVDYCKLGVHRNRRGLLKPVLMWVETGSAQRKTKTPFNYLWRGGRKGHNTGMIKPHPFMDEARREFEGKAPEQYKEKLTKNIVRVAKKYGCKV